MDIKILIADDDPVIRELVCDIVIKEGYTPVEACNGQEALNIFFQSTDIDLLILDVMMPICDGWQVLQEVREHAEVPIIMLTALDDEKHEIYSLSKGADDYIAKPFDYEVFVARINSILRKLKKERSTIINFGRININQATQKVTVADEEVELSRKEYSMIVYFVKNRKLVLTRDQLLSNVWGYDFDGDERTIDTHIKTLRAKLGECGGYIKTVRGSGYRLEVEEGEDDEND